MRQKVEEYSELDPVLLLRALKVEKGDVETKDIDEVIENFEN